QFWIGFAVHQLQQLCGKLDVAKSARAELDFTLALLVVDVVNNPIAHALHLTDEAGPRGCLPDHRSQDIEVALAQGQRTSNGSSFQQCLEFPSVGPALIVLQMRGNSPR